MRRILLGVAAAELLVGAIAVSALPAGRSAEPAPAVTITGDAVSQATLEPEPAGRESSKPKPGRQRGQAAHRASIDRRLTPDSVSTARNQISFKEPVDFATGAVPSSDAFNRAEGDQLGLWLLHVPLPDGLAVGDFDGDETPDVAQTNVLAGTVSVFLGDGRGGFEAPMIEPVGLHPIYVLTGHLDLDENVDLAVVNFGSNNVTILRGDGAGGFQPAATVAVPFPRHVAVANFNGDLIPDLAVASVAPSHGCPRSCSASPVGGVAILTGAEVGNDHVAFAPAQFIRTTRSATDQPVGANYAATGDFDGDGLDDLAVGVGFRRNSGDLQADGTVTGDDVLIFLNRNATGELFDDLPSQALRVGADPAATAVADLNGDGSTDLAVLSSGNGEVTTLLGNGDGHFVSRAGSVRVGGLQHSLEIADFNDDGLPDLVTASFHSSTVSVLQGNGDGTFQPAVDFWSGDAPTNVGVGDFDDDEQVDVVVARLRPDALALLLNDSPQRGDGVVITRDIPYVDPTGDPLAVHHNLDVYAPPPGTASFAGKGQPYPVVLFGHGGQGITLDKTMASFLMRSIAVEGIVAISINYRLGFGLEAGQGEDFAAALRWTRDNVGSRKYGGDPGNIIVFGYSAGAAGAMRLVTDPAHDDVQKSIRGLVFAGAAMPADKAPVDLPPAVLINGDQGLENVLMPSSAAFTVHAKRQGTKASHVIVEERDHLTLIARMARSDDDGRAAVLGLIRGD